MERDEDCDASVVGIADDDNKIMMGDYSMCTCLYVCVYVNLCKRYEMYIRSYIYVYMC